MTATIPFLAKQATGRRLRRKQARYGVGSAARHSASGVGGPAIPAGLRQMNAWSCGARRGSVGGRRMSFSARQIAGLPRVIRRHLLPRYGVGCERKLQGGHGGLMAMARPFGGLHPHSVNLFGHLISSGLREWGRLASGQAGVDHIVFGFYGFGMVVGIPRHEVPANLGAIGHAAVVIDLARLGDAVALGAHLGCVVADDLAGGGHVRISRFDNQNIRKHASYVKVLKRALVHETVMTVAEWPNAEET